LLEHSIALVIPYNTSSYGTAIHNIKTDHAYC
jgi:hypothetical protein